MQVSKQGCVSITSWQHLTWHFMTPARRTKFFLLLFQLFSACRYVEKIFWSSCGGPNMLNMPKSASGGVVCMLHEQYGLLT